MVDIIEDWPARDRLAEIFVQQGLFQEMLGKQVTKDTPDTERIQLIKDYVLAATDELHEVLNETGWKPWATTTRFNKDRIQAELVDVFCFFLNLCLVADVDADLLMVEYQKKMQTNFKRQARGYTDAPKCPACGDDQRPCECGLIC